MHKVSQAGLSTRRFFDHEGVKGKAIEKNITERNKKSLSSRLGKLLKKVVNINIFLRGSKSSQKNAAAQTINVKRESVNEASRLGESWKSVHLKTVNVNEKSPACSPYNEDFFRSAKKAPANLPPPPPASPPPASPASSLTPPASPPPASPASSLTPPASPPPASPASSLTPPASPPPASPASSLTPPASPPPASPASSLTQPASPPPVSTLMQPASPPPPPPPQFAPPPLPAEDFLKINNELKISALYGTGKKREVVQKEPGSNEQKVKLGGLFNDADVTKMNPFMKKIHQQMIESAKEKAKSDQEEAARKADEAAKKADEAAKKADEAAKKADEAAKEAQQQAQIKKDEAENSQASNGNVKDGVPPPPPLLPPLPLPTQPSPTENQPLGDRTLTETVGDRKVTFIQPKQVNVFKTPRNEAFVNELDLKVKARRAKLEQSKANSET